MFLCEEKGGSLAGRRVKRLASLATADKSAAAKMQPGETLDHLGESQQEQSAIAGANPAPIRA